MSASIGVNLLPFKEGTDMSEVKTFALEITRKASLAELGYDITDPANNPEEEFQSFGIYDEALCWSDFTGCRKHLDVVALVGQIVYRFPEMEFVYREFWDGPMVKEEYIKGDIREELESWFLDIGIDNSEALQKVQKEMPDVKQSGPFLLFPFAHYPVSKIRQSMEDTLHKVAGVIPDMTLYCVIGEDEDQGVIFEEKGVYADGQIAWEKMTDDETRVIWRGLEIWENEPTVELLDFLFKGLEIEITYTPNEVPDGDEEGGLPL